MKKKTQEFYEAFYKYIDLIQKLQFILDNNGMDFSSHTANTVTNDFLNQEYKKISDSNNIIADLNESKINFYKLCKDILNEEMKKYAK